MAVHKHSSARSLENGHSEFGWDVGPVLYKLTSITWNWNTSGCCNVLLLTLFNVVGNHGWKPCQNSTMPCMPMILHPETPRVLLGSKVSLCRQARTPSLTSCERLVPLRHRRMRIRCDPRRVPREKLMACVKRLILYWTGILSTAKGLLACWYILLIKMVAPKHERPL